MNNMSRNFFRIVLIAAALSALVSCSAAKVVYFQDTEDKVPIALQEAELIRFEPGDQLRIMIQSRDPEIVRIFNLLSDSAYSIDQQGNIDMPVIGQIRIAGLTRNQAIQEIKYKLLELKLVKDPIVTIQYEGLGYYVLGEVSSRGRKDILRDKITIMEAIAEANDLTIDGQRDNVLVLRTEGDVQIPYRVSLLDTKSLYASPAYYIRQNDIIYVEPNNKRRTSTMINGTQVFTPGFWVSTLTFVMSIVTLLSR